MRYPGKTNTDNEGVDNTRLDINTCGLEEGGAKTGDDG